MTTANAQAALDKLESDEAFAQKVRESGQDNALSTLQAEGFDVTAEDMRDAALDRYGDELSPEQLDSVSGGYYQGGGPEAAAALAAGIV